MTRIRIWATLAGAVALMLAASPRAEAILAVTITDSGGPTINIDSTDGTFSFSGGLATHQYRFKINGANQTFTTNGSGAFTGGTLTNADDTQVTFAATGAGTGTNALSLFGNYAINSFSATPNEDSSESNVFGSSLDVGKTTAAAGDTLTFTPSYSFTLPDTHNVILESQVATTTNQAPSTVSIYSSINGTNGQTASVSASNATDIKSQYVDVTTSPYLVTSHITVTNLANTKTVNFTADTNIYATPEPATMAMVIAGLPVIYFGRRLRARAKAQV